MSLFPSSTARSTAETPSLSCCKSQQSLQHVTLSLEHSQVNSRDALLVMLQISTESPACHSFPRAQPGQQQRRPPCHAANLNRVSSMSLFPSSTARSTAETPSLSCCN